MWAHLGGRNLKINCKFVCTLVELDKIQTNPLAPDEDEDI